MVTSIQMARMMRNASRRLGSRSFSSKKASAGDFRVAAGAQASMGCYLFCADPLSC